MTIGFLHFPYLVQENVIENMNLCAAIALTTVATKPKEIVRTCFRNKKFFLHYDVNDSFTIRRNYPFIEAYPDQFVIELAAKVYPEQSWKFFDETPISVLTRDEGSLAFASCYQQSKEEISANIMRYYIHLFPKLSLSVEFKILPTIELFRRTMRMVEAVEDLDYFGVFDEIEERYPRTHDLLQEIIFNECRRARTARFNIRTSPRFRYGYQTHDSFNFDHFSLTHAAWVTKDHFIKFFMGCKRVDLAVNYSDRNIVAILKSWTKKSSLSYIVIEGHPGFYRHSTLTNVVAHLPRAVRVEKASIIVSCFSSEYQNVSFTAGRCYEIKQDSGREALVLYIHDFLYLITDYKILKTDEQFVNAEKWRPPAVPNEVISDEDSSYNED
ncbi:hypothetical protein CAEBREN_16593 [Caenorhabditis brenneri]|uniref:F-box associated domain-containing protein n=1 Tax=Caenorhabditis brenneri TaxID=135651 RepID=G0NNV3_CAEBE|nr:hypothetical protein CAEBREN_16593 [Caenorhabditis brenneri]